MNFYHVGGAGKFLTEGISLGEVVKNFLYAMIWHFFVFDINVWRKFGGFYFLISFAQWLQIQQRKYIGMLGHC